MTNLKNTNDLKAAYIASNSPIEACDFVDFTFKIINSKKDYLQSAIFTFGREDLIPDMFISIVNDANKNFPDSISYFKYDLERHIEVDGGEHSQLALQMTSNLCGSNEQYWMEAEQAVIESLQKRIQLWDAVYHSIIQRREHV